MSADRRPCPSAILHSSALLHSSQHSVAVIDHGCCGIDAIKSDSMLLIAKFHFLMQTAHSTEARSCCVQVLSPRQRDLSGSSEAHSSCLNSTIQHAQLRGQVQQFGLIFTSCSCSSAEAAADSVLHESERLRVLSKVPLGLSVPQDSSRVVTRGPLAKGFKTCCALPAIC